MAPEKLMIEYDLKPDEFGKDLSTTLAKGVMSLGYIRLASIKNRLNLDFKQLDHSKFVVGPPPLIDESNLAQEILAKNPRCSHSAKDLIVMMQGTSKSSHDCWQVSCGHDMTAALSVMLTSKFGRSIPSYTVERQLRLCYHPSDFASTQLRKEIKEWEANSAPYRILKKL